MNNLEHIPVEQLQEARIDLDHQIAALRERKLAIAQEIERRVPEAEPEDRPAAQTLTPGFVESEAVAFSLDEPQEEDETPVITPRRRWWR
jgi:hypothetical protein